MKTLTLQQMRSVGFTDAECHAALVSRIEDSINEWRMLAHECFKSGDQVGVWEAGQHIKEMERLRDSMRKPRG